MDVDNVVMRVVDEVVVGFIVVAIVEGFVVVSGAVAVSAIKWVVDFVVVRAIVVARVVVCEDVVVCWIVGEAVVWVVDDTKTESVLEADETSVL